jgi:hypothetical protein
MTEELRPIEVVGVVAAGAVVGVVVLAASLVWAGAELVDRAIEVGLRRRT